MDREELLRLHSALREELDPRRHLCVVTAAEMHEPCAAMFVAMRVIVMCGVIRHICVKNVLDEMRDLLCQLRRWQDGEEEQKGEQPQWHL